MKYSFYIFALLTLTTQAGTLPVRLVHSDAVRLSAPHQTRSGERLIVSGFVQRLDSSSIPISAHMDVCLLDAENSPLACRKESIKFPNSRGSKQNQTRYSLGFEPEEWNSATTIRIQYETMYHKSGNPLNHTHSF